MPIYKADGKKDGLQKYNVVVNYTDDNGKKRQLKRTTYGITQAKFLEDKLIDSLSVNANQSVTFDTVFNEYMKLYKTTVREVTYNIQCSKYDNHIKPFFKDMKISKIGIKQLNEWQIYIADKKLSSNYNKLLFATLKSIFKYALKNGYIDKNPMDIVDNFRDAYSTKKEMLFYTPDEFKKFIAVALQDAQSSNYFDFYVFFNIAYYTGCRRGEIMALQWSDIKSNRLSITKSYSKSVNKVTPPKNESSNREIELPIPLIKILEEHKTRQQNKYKSWNKSALICGYDDFLNITTLTNKCKNFAKIAGVKEIRIHDFRHSHASLLINNGITAIAVSKRLGHSNTNQTLKTYAHLFKDENERMLEVLNNI